MKHLIAPLALALLSAASLARASAIVRYDFDGGSTVPHILAAGVSAGEFTSVGGQSNGPLDEGGLINPPAPPAFFSVLAGAAAPTIGPASAARHVFNKDFGNVAGPAYHIEFTLSSDSPLSLSRLSFDVARGGAGHARSFMLVCSLDGFASPEIVLGGGDTPARSPANTFANFSFDLSRVPALQNLSGRTVTFRLYGVGIQSSKGYTSLRFDNLVVEGNAPVATR